MLKQTMYIYYRKKICLFQLSEFDGEHISFRNFRLFEKYVNQTWLVFSLSFEIFGIEFPLVQFVRISDCYIAIHVRIFYSLSSHNLSSYDIYKYMYIILYMYAFCRVTVKLRYFPKYHIQKFMAEAVSFLLRNAPFEQLKEGTTLHILCFHF